MQTPAERHVIDTVARILGEPNVSRPARVLNIGAGTSLVLEEKLAHKGCEFTCDRLDIAPSEMSHPLIGQFFTCSVESMGQVESEAYDVAFSNYVLEHVDDLTSAASEIRRVLKPGAAYVASVPNPAAPEFLLARVTPLWFHRLLRGGSGWETRYSYRSISHLCAIFGTAGLAVDETAFYAVTSTYLARFPVVGWASTAYDRVVDAVGPRFLKGNVCLTFRKHDPGIPRLPAEHPGK